MDNRKKDEVELFNKFKATGKPQYFQELYGSMKNLVYDAARKSSYGSNLPESAHKIYAAQAFMDALRTYNPNSGAALQTHVYSAVQNKTKRLNYEYQNLGSIPEPRAQKIGLFQNELSNMKDELGREPSAAELADRLHWGIKDVTRLQKEMTKDLSMGEGTDEVPFTEGSQEEETLYHLYFDLTAEEKVVYEYITGRYGKPKLVKSNNKVDFDGIAKRMGVSASKVRSLHSSIRVKFEKALR